MDVGLFHQGLLGMVDLWSVCDEIGASSMVHAVQFIGNESIIVGFDIWVQLSFGLVKSQSIGIAIEVVSNGWYVLSDLVRITIFVYDIDDAFDHLLLRDLASDDRVVGKVFTKPNFDNAHLIDANVWLLNLKKVIYFLSEQVKSMKTLVIEM